MNHVAHHHLAVTHGAMTRRGFIGNMARGSALVLGGTTLRPLTALATNSDPKPINGSSLPPFHVYFVSFKEGGPPAVYDQSTITDFEGVFASTDVTGWGKDNTGRELYFRCDMRFVQGRYLDVHAPSDRAASDSYDSTYTNRLRASR